MKPGRLPAVPAQQRDHIEAILLELVCLQDFALEVQQRTRQAIRRTALVEPVLAPSLQRLEHITQAIKNIHAELIEYWKVQQEQGWE